MSLAQAYVEVWNEREPRARRAKGAEVLAADVVYVDPNASIEGRASVDAYVAAWQEAFQDYRFRLGTVRCHHNVLHIRWSFGPRGCAAVATGEDFIVVEHGRVGKVYGFFDADSTADRS